jgi:hypothetical protein
MLLSRKPRSWWEMADLFNLYNWTISLTLPFLATREAIMRTGGDLLKDSNSYSDGSLFIKGRIEGLSINLLKVE